MNPIFLIPLLTWTATASDHQPAKHFYINIINDPYALLPRQDGYPPQYGACDSGETCAEACGSAFEPCEASTDLALFCYDPSAGQTCCPNGRGTKKKTSAQSPTLFSKRSQTKEKTNTPPQKHATDPTAAPKTEVAIPSAAKTYFSPLKKTPSSKKKKENQTDPQPNSTQPVKLTPKQTLTLPQCASLYQVGELFPPLSTSTSTSAPISTSPPGTSLTTETTTSTTIPTTASTIEVASVGVRENGTTTPTPTTVGNFTAPMFTGGVGRGLGRGLVEVLVVWVWGFAGWVVF
ncbi:hypothetical protein M501DRAFT_1061327 [Patellaria atrata CBS 101060]|uniref:Uncharacterized protein n=1 Tax=Patellaria atrata CBS 101060 TaxID=1346257 RepID=A0A9P4VM94_9PEZI|nr:hypothetical protein M501DRAFT_1061327 [Patellaria atrata CBS 101060]